MKIKFIVLGVVLCLISSCAGSPMRTHHTNTAYGKVEGLPLGQSRAEVLKTFGTPESQETVHLKNKKYKSMDYVNADEYKSQRITILLDPTSENIVAKTFIPNDNEPESSLLHLTKKDTHQRFSYYLKPRCSDHSASGSGLAIDTHQGIIIEYWKKDLGVLSISWLSQERTADISKELEACQKAKDQP